MGVPVLLLRHGVTSWNEVGRIQGRTDIGLSPAGRAALEGLSVPGTFATYDWHVTPLRRTAETAAALGVDAPRVEPRLLELDWGEWEGRTRAELEHELGERFAAMGRRGLDFRPPGGESSRELRARLLAWLEVAARAARPVAAVSHKGVIQMALALATGWDLVSKRPHRLRWDCAHLFVYESRTGVLTIDTLDIELEPRAGGC